MKEPNPDKKKEPALFDATRPISIKTLCSEVIKTIVLKFPTDEQWLDRARRQKVVYRNLGRGIQQPVNPDPDEADADLVNGELRLEPGPDVDAFEAGRILDELSRTQLVDDPAFEAGLWTVTLRVPGALTSHMLRMPTSKERFRYEQGITGQTNAGNREIWCFNPQVGGDLYVKTCQSQIGYTGPVPIVHQAAVASAVIKALDRALGVGDPENF